MNTHCSLTGGDWGAYICKALGMNHSANCKALHLTSNFSMPTWYNPLHYLQLLNATKLQNVPLLVSKEEIARFQNVLKFLKTGNGGSQPLSLLLKLIAPAL